MVLPQITRLPALLTIQSRIGARLIMKIKILFGIGLGFIVFISLVDQCYAQDYVGWPFGLTDTPPECSAGLELAQYGDESLSNLCICREIVEGENVSYKWCEIGGDSCGTSTSCG